MAIMAVILCVQQASAQKRVREFGIFDHLGIGASIGTTGYGFQVAAPITDYLQLRAGYSFAPNLKYTEKDVDYETFDGGEGKTDIEGKLNMGDLSLLLDIYPFKKPTFHFTVGFFSGKERVITAYNTKPVDVDGSLEIGDYKVEFDKDGFANAAIQVNKFKPYIGIGFGRAVPRKRVGFSFEMGTQFWGTPGVYAKSGDGSWQELTSSDLDKKDEGGIDLLSKITIYPVITFRLTGRIF